MKMSKLRGFRPVKFIKPDLEELTNDEITVLMDFYSRGSKTLGQIVSSPDGLVGSKIIGIVEKLRDFGFIRRDWEKEIEMGVDVVYSLTDFGRETIMRHNHEAAKQNSRFLLNGIPTPDAA